jgi:hypothetical protein
MTKYSQADLNVEHDDPNLSVSKESVSIDPATGRRQPVQNPAPGQHCKTVALHHVDTGHRVVVNAATVDGKQTHEDADMWAERGYHAGKPMTEAEKAEAAELAAIEAKALTDARAAFEKTKAARVAGAKKP